MQAYQPDRVARVLNSLVSIAYFGLLVLAVGVLIGLPAVKLAAADDPDWKVGLVVPVASVGPNATVVTRWGDARLEVEEMRGSLRLPVGMLPWWLFGIIWTYVAAAITLMLMFLHHLRHIFRRVRNGAPFDSTNVVRLRWLGLIAVGFAVLSGVSGLITSLAVRGHVIGERVEIPLGLSVDGSMVFFGLVLLALAEIFRHGAELEYEQSLTV